MGRKKILAKLLVLDESGDPKLLNSLWNDIDKDRDGYLEGKEYRKFMDCVIEYMVEDLKFQFSREQIQQMTEQVMDRDGDGRVDKKEFFENLQELLDACEGN